MRRTADNLEQLIRKMLPYRENSSYSFDRFAVVGDRHMETGQQESGG